MTKVRRGAMLIGAMALLSGSVLARYLFFPVSVTERIVHSEKTYGAWIDMPETLTWVDPGQNCEMMLDQSSRGPTFRFRRTGQREGVGLPEMDTFVGSVEPFPNSPKAIYFDTTAVTYRLENKEAKPKAYQMRFRPFWNDAAVKREARYWNGHIERTDLRKKYSESPGCAFEMALKQIQ